MAAASAWHIVILSTIASGHGIDGDTGQRH
jgi:hypothetical protein